MPELLTPAEMSRADALTIAAGTAGIELMERAGRAVADAAAAFSPRRVVVFAGPGNNGGDGFVAARLLADRGIAVAVRLLGNAAALRGDAAIAAACWQGETAEATPEVPKETDLIIDALFGAGLDRPLAGKAAGVIEAVNASGRPVLAVDLPSGIDGATGAVLGCAVRAARTVTFFRKKPGHLLLPGRSHCGETQVADIGIGSEVLAEIRPHTFENGPDLWRDRFPVPRLEGHKYTRGHAVVVSGGASTTGAARLAARGALRAGAGLVTIASPPEALPVHAAANLAVMVRAAEGAPGLRVLLADHRLNAVVIGPGCGVGEDTRHQVLAALDGARGVVLDADALTSFASKPEVLFEAIRRREPAATVLTPHTGEFDRIFNALKKDSEPELKLEKARLAARQSGAIVVLKGADTVIASPDSRAVINANAPPWLATAGSGDVLAGVIGGLLAQEMPAFEAASAAVWLHGAAAAAFGPGLISEDLPEALPGVLRALYAQI